jgi:N-formylglutamate amidohydrolase
MSLERVSSLRRAVLAGILLLSGLLGVNAPHDLYADEPPKLIYHHAGALPIILSAPHGGQLDVPGVSERTGEGQVKAAGKFVAARDGGTEELAHALSKAIERRLGKQSYVVLSRVHRKFLDPNRPAELAYEDPDAKPIYDAYHHTLSGYCRDVQKQFRHGLLLDLHGQGVAAETVFRGTQNGTTVALLRERYGEAAHTGEASLLGQLRRRAWKVNPDPFDGREHSGFTGGYIVRTYGGIQGLGVDAIQPEFGHDYRTVEARSKTAETLAEALGAYGDLYLDFKRHRVQEK